MFKGVVGVFFLDHGKEKRSNIRSRRGKKVSKNAALMDELVVAAQNVYNIEPPFTPTSPLTRTPHPVNPHQAAEEEQMNQVGLFLLT